MGTVLEMKRKLIGVAAAVLLLAGCGDTADEGGAGGGNPLLSGPEARVLSAFGSIRRVAGSTVATAAWAPSRVSVPGTPCRVCAAKSRMARLTVPARAVQPSSNPVLSGVATAADSARWARP